MQLVKLIITLFTPSISTLIVDTHRLLLGYDLFFVGTQIQLCNENYRTEDIYGSFIFITSVTLDRSYLNLLNDKICLSENSVRIFILKDLKNNIKKASDVFNNANKLLQFYSGVSFSKTVLEQKETENGNMLEVTLNLDIIISVPVILTQTNERKQPLRFVLPISLVYQYEILLFQDKRRFILRSLKMVKIDKLPGTQILLHNFYYFSVDNSNQSRNFEIGNVNHPSSDSYDYIDENERREEQDRNSPYSELYETQGSTRSFSVGPQKCLPKYNTFNPRTRSIVKQGVNSPQSRTHEGGTRPTSCDNLHSSLTTQVPNSKNATSGRVNNRFANDNGGNQITNKNLINRQENLIGDPTGGDAPSVTYIIIFQYNDNSRKQSTDLEAKDSLYSTSRSTTELKFSRRKTTFKNIQILDMRDSSSLSPLLFRRKIAIFLASLVFMIVLGVTLAIYHLHR